MEVKEKERVEPLVRFNIGIDKALKQEVTDYLKDKDGVSLSMLTADGIEKEFEKLKDNRIPISSLRIIEKEFNYLKDNCGYFESLENLEKELKDNFGYFKSLRKKDFVYAQTNICLKKDLKKEVSEYLEDFKDISLSLLAETGLKKEYLLMKTNDDIHKAKVERDINEVKTNIQRASDNLILVALALAKESENITIGKIVVLGRKAQRFTTAINGLNKKMSMLVKVEDNQKKLSALEKAENDLISVASRLAMIDKKVTVTETVELSKDAVRFSKAYELVKGV